MSLDNGKRWAGSRRGFLAGTGVVIAAATFSRWPGLAIAQSRKADLLASIPKDDRLIVHVLNPGVIETPQPLLDEASITPKELLFVRNNQVPPGYLKLAPPPPEDWRENWTVEFSGLVSGARTIPLREIDNVDELIEIEMVLQCSGNGRAYYEQSVRTRGTQWRKGGMGNVRWRGVRLRTAMAALGLQADERVRFVTAEGADAPPTEQAEDFEHSLPWNDMRDTALLAFQMNGEPTPAIHGGPVRLILPGYYGTMNVKWLTKLRFETEESANRNHAQRYRTFNDPVPPGSTPEVTMETTTASWRQKVKSVFLRPLDDVRLSVGQVELSGVAWNDGRARIDAVEISLDQGASWQRARIAPTANPYGWHHWSHRVELAQGQHEAWVRATDARGNTQPIDGSIHWNPSGYEWNGVDKVRFSVS